MLAPNETLNKFTPKVARIWRVSPLKFMLAEILENFNFVKEKEIFREKYFNAKENPKMSKLAVWKIYIFPFFIQKKKTNKRKTKKKFSLKSWHVFLIEMLCNIHFSNICKISGKLLSFVSGTKSTTNIPPINALIEKISITPLMPMSWIIDSRYFNMTKAKIHESARQNE